MTGAILGLGSNQGDRTAHLRAAIRALDTCPELRVRRISALYESEAMLAPGAPAAWNQPFLNLAVDCVWVAGRPPAERLLERVKAIEAALGRPTRERWAPRPIDIDILDWDGGAVAGEKLRIPHAGLGERPFALLPFLDLHPASLSGELTRVAMEWRLGDSVPFGSRRAGRSLTRFMGVLNLTPDSFSDGGRFNGEPARAVAQAKALHAGGAEVIDLGPESTRPGAAAIGPEEELARLLPVLTALKAELPEAVLSVDTRRPEVARRALAGGAAWINDVTGFERPEMLAVVRESGCRVVAMHSLGIPPSRARQIPEGGDPLDYLLRWGHEKIRALERAGIARERVILDPGIGFGTSARQAWRVLGEAERLHELGVEILIGHSRKSFLAEIASTETAAERDLETATLSALLAAKGIDWLRVHEVEANARAVRAWARVDGVVHWRRE